MTRMHGLPVELLANTSHAERDRVAGPEAKIEFTKPLYLEATFTTKIGFRDQVEFKINEPEKRIDFRSRSKFGLYDFGKNRSRMLEFSARFMKVAGDAKKVQE